MGQTRTKPHGGRDIRRAHAATGSHQGTMQLLVATQSDAVTENAETVVIYRMRKKLKRHGIEIATVHRGGYYLTPDMKDHVRGLQ